MSEQNPNVENQSIYEEPAAQVLGSDAAVEIPAEVQDVPVTEPVAVEPAAVEPAATAEPAPAIESAGAVAAAATAAATAGVTTGAQNVNPYANAQGAQQFGQPGPQQWSQPAGQQQPWQQPAQQYQQYQQPQSNPYANAQYGWQQTSPAVTKGPLERAWGDFMADAQKVKKTGLLTLVNCVPILNFVSAGYALKWAESAARQQGAVLPEKIVDGENFKFGFFQWLVAIAIGIVMGLIACIPMVGWIVCLFGVPFVFLASVRMYLYRDLGAAFALSDLWEKFKNDVGGTMFISWIPSLIGGAIVSVIALVCMMVGGVSFAGLAIAAHSHDAALGAGAGAFAITLVVVLIIVCALVNTIVNLIAFRAFGYWAIDHAPDWVAGVKPVNPQAGNPYGAQPPYGQQNPYQQAQQYGQPYQQPYQQPMQQPQAQQWQPQPQAQPQPQMQPQQQPQQGADRNQQ